MSYSDDELFDIVGGDYDGRAFVWDFLKGNDPEVTSVAIPAEYNGYPVREINRFSFSDCQYLREVVIPDSVDRISEWAFYNCPELRSIRLPKNAVIGIQAFSDCPKLPAEVLMAGLVGGAADITKPFDTSDFLDEDCIYTAETKLDWGALLRPDVLALAIKYDSFRDIGTKALFEHIVRNGLFEQFSALERAGIRPSPEQTDLLIEWRLEVKWDGSAEMIAFLLDYKRRTFGFTGDDFNL